MKEGAVKVDGIDLNYIPHEPVETFWRMFQHEEFDASELSMSGYILERARGIHRFITIPVFPSRMFRHSCIYINIGVGVKGPEDLKGKAIGVPGYHMTAALWVKGILHHEYAVKPTDVVWRTGLQEQPGRKERVELKLPHGIIVKPIPETETLDAMLERGGPMGFMPIGLSLKPWCDFPVNKGWLKKVFLWKSYLRKRLWMNPESSENW